MSRTAVSFQPLLAFLAVAIIRMLVLTWRIKLHGPDPATLLGPVIFCFWHGHQAGLLAYPRARPAVVMASLSKDGALQAKILTRLNFKVVRGSSSKGGAKGLKAVVSRIRQGDDALFALDGPRGPIHQIKPGVILAAKSTGAPLIPVRAAADRAWIFRRAWDCYTLPKPFARVDIYRGAPITANQETTEIEAALMKALR